MKTDRVNILGLSLNHITFNQALAQVKDLGLNHIPSYVCFANVHMTIEAYKDKTFAHQVNSATLVLADGNPLAKSFRLLYNKKQERIAGMDFLPRMLEYINTGGFKVFFYGSSNDVLNALQQTIAQNYKHIHIAGAISPPFRVLSEKEQDEYISQINNSGAHIVFVALGCPKQERWMHEHHPKINAVCLGVGGAFSVMAGMQKRAPRWMQQFSLEWVYRLMQEPRRLFKRYFVTNTLFIVLLAARLMKKLLHGN